MKLSKQRRASMAVLGLALTALAVDRAFLSPQSASAGALNMSQPPPLSPGLQTDPIQTSRPARPAAQPQPVPDAGGLLPLRDRIERALLKEPAPVDFARDAFARPSAATLQDPASPQSDTDDHDQAHAKAFQARHGEGLSASLSSGTGSSIIISGQRLNVGETLDGFKLVEVTRSAAIFTRGQVRIELTLTPHLSRPARDQAR